MNKKMKDVSAPFNDNFLEDSSLNQKSVYVPDDVKKAIKAWAKDMMLDESLHKKSSSYHIPMSMKKITVGDLKRVMSQTLAEERALDTLREEIFKAFGPPVNTDVKIEIMAEEANDRLDLFERTGRELKYNLKPSLLLKFSGHPSQEVRRLVSRLLPEGFIGRFISDKSPEVIHEIAKRLPLREVKTLVKRRSGDDQLLTIYRDRLVKEGDEPVRAGEVLKGKVKAGLAIPELSDSWYDQMAFNALSDYGVEHGGPLENSWDESFVKRYCSSLKATTGTECDPERLWGAIQKILDERDDEALVKNKLKGAAKRVLERKSTLDRRDSLHDLVEARCGNIQFVNLFCEFFDVRESNLVGSLYRAQLSEGKSTEFGVPYYAKLPAGYKFSPLIEKAVDRFVHSWNGIRAQRGDLVRINWMPYTDSHIVRFTSEIV
jgi:hypothetical protein